MRKNIFFMIVIIVLILAACGGNEDGAKKDYLTIVTASSGGTYYPIGVGLGDLWSEKLDGLNATGQSSAGSVENIDLLRNDEADLAILQGLIGAQAIEGTGNFEGKPYDKLRSIAMLWPNVEHFVLSDDKVSEGTIEDIQGNSFSVGPQASGTEQSTLTIMEGIGLTENDIKPEYLGYDDTVSAMRDGNLDGGSLPAGIPVSAIMDMYASGFDGTVLEVTDEQLESINSIYDTWFRFVIPDETYPGVEEDIETIAMPNFLGVSADLNEEQVYELTKVMFENLDDVHEIHNSAQEVSLDTALDGLPAPLHVGAYKYFKEQDLDIPEELVPPETE
ncbi:MAG TPA: TAXI family TRAP transporter solute-binding subunit [Virgibacillus sp.]|nr:TAXI family TRAP transporter solute-binding subunit [Virgibacillus sp.]